MCRLFGLSAGSEPVRATFWLLQAPDSLQAQSHREPDGTGLGYFDPQGHPVVEKQPQAAFTDQAFAREAKTASSTTFVGHIRFASTGGLELRNTHPFEQAGRLFAHNGVVEDLPALERHLGPEGMAPVQGDTDSERLFALVTQEIDRHGGDARAGIAAAVHWVAEHLRLLSLNFVLIRPEELWALRYPDVHELHVLERDPADRGALEQTSSHGTRISSEPAAERRTVVIASEPMDQDPGWRELRSGELLHVSPSLEVSSEIVVPGPPAKPLSLTELGEQAKRSQSETSAK